MASNKEKPDGAVAIENFYGVYLLYCTNPKYKGRTYIGFTVDPNRRINQHNIGKKAGGAWRTSNRGPWEMVLIIHGFLDDIAALRFEWAWQHPDRSRHLRGCFSAKKSSESSFLYNLRILAEMLSVGPWNRLPLTIQWLVPSYEKPFPAHKPPPFHMSICYGHIYTVKVNAPSTTEGNGNKETKMCWVCMEDATITDMLSCIRPQCFLVAHTTCLAKRFLGDEKDHILPVEGSCPRCKSNILWGDLIRKKRGCYVDLETNDCDGDKSILSG